jgi:TolA-binding protein
MTRSAPLSSVPRFAACLAAAGLLLLAPAAAQTQLPPPAFGQADNRQDRIEELERQLREATAENERLQFQLHQAQREVTRLNGVVGELAGVNQSLQQTPPPAEGGGAQTPPPRPQPPAPAPPRQTGALGTLPAAQLPGTEAQAYSYARELQTQGRYADAEAAFAQLLQTYPNGETAIDTRFLLARTQLARNNFRDAAQNFIRYMRAAPQGPRAPEAQLGLGMALMGLSQDGENDAAERRQACEAFTLMPQNTPRQVRERAAGEARAAHCAG